MMPGMDTSSRGHVITLHEEPGRVVVARDGTVLAETGSAVRLEETGCPPRWYLPREDVRMALLAASDTVTTCPFKGEASYWSYEPAGAEGADLAWSYEDPIDDVAAITGRLCFYAERTTTTVDGTPV